MSRFSLPYLLVQRRVAGRDVFVAVAMLDLRLIAVASTRVAALTDLCRQWNAANPGMTSADLVPRGPAAAAPGQESPAPASAKASKADKARQAAPPRTPPADDGGFQLDWAFRN